MAIVGAFGTILGLIAAFLSFLPHITAVPTYAGANREANAAVIDVSNDNIIPVWHANFGIILCSLDGRPEDQTELHYCFLSDKNRRSVLIRPDWSNQTLDRGAHFPISITDIFALPNFVEEDFAILISYNTWFLPWSQERIFHFVTKAGADGRLYLYPSTVM